MQGKYYLRKELIKCTINNKEAKPTKSRLEYSKSHTNDAVVICGFIKQEIAKLCNKEREK